MTASCAAALLALGAGAFALPAGAQTGPGQGESSGTPSIVVTATRLERNSFELPVSIDRIDAAAIREGKPMINLSESLSRVPGVVVQNRQNYSQDLQISSRGFGAHARFGVRGYDQGAQRHFGRDFFRSEGYGEVTDEHFTVPRRAWLSSSRRRPASLRARS
jgi:outer membrane receptor protein involved in Fe transport